MGKLGSSTTTPEGDILKSEFKVSALGKSLKGELSKYQGSPGDFYKLEESIGAARKKTKEDITNWKDLLENIRKKPPRKISSILTDFRLNRVFLILLF